MVRQIRTYAGNGQTDYLVAWALGVPGDAGGSVMRPGSAAGVLGRRNLD